MTHCHCPAYRKAHSALQAPGAGAKYEHFRWLQGSEHLKSYNTFAGKFAFPVQLVTLIIMNEILHQAHVIARVSIR